MSEELTPPQPTAEHNRLKELAGKWNVDCEFYMDPTQPPMKSAATETVEMFGQFFATSRFQTEMFGAPFEGRSVIGYQPETKTWASTWCDTSSPNLFHMTGTLDASGEVLTMTGEAIDCQSGKMTGHRTVEKTIDPNTREFDMYMTSPATGDEIHVFHFVYTRA
jgi:hypothetical protein